LINWQRAQIARVYSWEADDTLDSAITVTRPLSPNLQTPVLSESVSHTTMISVRFGSRRRDRPLSVR
jgi:hypothetical protein